MFRIDSPGATVGNLFTEGNPATGVPATEVSADWLNDTVQEELVGVVEDAGLTLAKGDNTQLLQSLKILLARGGDQLKQAVTNNSSNVDITGLIFDKTTIKSAWFKFDIERRTDTSHVDEMGEVLVLYDNEAGAWKAPDWSSSFDGAGVTFNITSTGQVRYTSDDLTGANYSGNIRITDIKKIEQGV
jgi:hypothetical protein